jgi:hypothetical protein
VLVECHNDEAGIVESIPLPLSSTGAAVTELTAPSKTAASRRIEDMVGFVLDAS